MGRFIINGGKPLFGEITVGGSKNAALPIIFSTLLTSGETTLIGVPDIGDVDVALDILRGFGATSQRNGSRISIDTSQLEYSKPSDALVSKIRASSYLLGASLGSFGKAEIMRFGGCNFDARPIDMHIHAAEALGASLNGGTLTAKKLIGADIYFDKISVGATVNAIIMAVSAYGVSRIFGYAREPHIISLIEFFKKGGVNIELHSDFIKIVGKKPNPAEFEIIPDMIEAGTYIALSLITDSKIKVNGLGFSELESFLLPLVSGGAVIEYDKSSVTPYDRLSEPVSIITAPYPEYPTDLHPQLVPLLAVSCGGRIEEGVWHNRFGYLAELSRFGVEYELETSAVNIKKSYIKPAQAAAPDLRGGAALLLSALYAEGESVIDGAEIIKRGYGNIVEKLTAIGADIKEV